jgi:hypothetical protein
MMKNLLLKELVKDLKWPKALEGLASKSLQIAE